MPAVSDGKTSNEDLLCKNKLKENRHELMLYYDLAHKFKNTPHMYIQVRQSRNFCPFHSTIVHLINL